ncbi:MAG TPA: hypothetical protein VFG54_11980 [Prolixibacteraceae bacterium]|nr:hypothetical protein [Prolixibacteraceae bacterium]
MKNYFRHDITICVDIEAHKDVLKEAFGENLSNCDYDSKLIYNQRNPEYLQLTIYYKQSDYLFEKFELLQKNGISILSLIKPKINIHQWEHPDILIFSQSNIVEIQDSPFWEHNKKPVIITIDNAEILLNGRYVGDGRFKLTKNVFQHLDEYVIYGGLGRHRWDDKFIEKDVNRETTFGPINFILSFEHFYEQKYSKQNIYILRDAYLTLTDSTEKLTDNELIQIGKSLCLLMSFYWGKPIDFFIANIRVNNIENYRTREILKYADHFIDDSHDFLLKKKFKTFYDFAESVDYGKFIANSDILFEIIPRILKTKNVDEISSFMVLYNIIEKIRNYYLTSPSDGKQFTIKEEFDFKLSKKKTNEYIKNKIKEIIEIVVDTDAEEFENKASDKVTFIRKTGLKDQFDSLLTYLELEPKSYDIDFVNLINIRNNIYHGKLPEENIKPHIAQMINILNDMILKMTIN